MTAKYIFSKKRDPMNEYDNADITFEFSAVTLEQMHEAYLDFLAGCAFQVQGLTVKLINEHEEMIP